MLQTAIIAFSLSTDAFAASIAKGARFRNLSMLRTTGIALGFGFLEALAPLLGYLLGKQFEGLIADVDHWVAFGLLSVLGARMIWKSVQDERAEAAPVAAPTWGLVALTALGTSVDASAVGVTLALVSDNIPLTLLAIGFVTFAMTFLGLRLGGLIGEKVGRWAEGIGGVGLAVIGLHILLTHLGA
ncbi:MAG TPA: manganese efflux pump MntP family protein [Beijerinckiaceae bacterium]|jgi:putative Mn2+ efflux pump MntP